ncbi:MAG: DUF3800 domain-containing protein [Paracoccus denitrificans]|uniref:DUF3800 domain-containing protein n=1 Tax=Paracoccus denitrificans TaxID=266 RepID=A0A533I0E4_PARDE|nr:MAG: DUF3800 domain-containing protein [Paracoccus denitrificans]
MSPLVVFYGIGLLVVVAVIVLAVTLGRRANHREGLSSARERTREAQHRRARMDAGGVDRAERGGVQGGVHSGPVREPASQTAGKIGSVLIAYIDESYDQDTYFIGAAVANEAAWELVADGYDAVRQRTALLHPVPDGAEFHGHELDGAHRFSPELLGEVPRVAGLG